MARGCTRVGSGQPTCRVPLVAGHLFIFVTQKVSLSFFEFQSDRGVDDGVCSG